MRLWDRHSLSDAATGVRHRAGRAYYDDTELPCRPAVGSDEELDEQLDIEADQEEARIAYRDERGDDHE